MELFGLVAVSSLVAGVAFAAFAAVILLGVAIGASLAIYRAVHWRRSLRATAGELVYLTMPGEAIAAEVLAA